MNSGGAGSAEVGQSPAPVDALDADEHDEFEWFRAGRRQNFTAYSNIASWSKGQGYMNRSST